MLRLVEAPDQEQATDCEITCKPSVQAVSVLFEYHARSVERFGRPAQVTRGEGNLGLGYDASGARPGLFWTESARSLSQEFLGSYEITELCHRDASKRERRRIVAQCDSLQRAEGIARREGASCRRDQRVHWNPATLVTSTPSMPRAKYNAWQSNTKSQIDGT
jgi:hypothetical protein